MTDLYNAVLDKGVYDHHFCIQKTLDQSILDITTCGNNCAEYGRLTERVRLALNQTGKSYTGRIVHLWCRNRNGVPLESLGHYFNYIDGEVFDLSEAASGKGEMGSNMCSNGYEIEGYDSIC
jgi:hypothetical protein